MTYDPDIQATGGPVWGRFSVELPPDAQAICGICRVRCDSPEAKTRHLSSQHDANITRKADYIEWSIPEHQGVRAA